MNFKELTDFLRLYNKIKHITRQYEDKNPLKCYVVLSNESFLQEYSLDSRTYEFRSDEKFFISGLCGTSIFATSLDGKDNIRLDWYISEWIIEECYIIGELTTK